LPAVVSLRRGRVLAAWGEGGGREEERKMGGGRRIGEEEDR